MNRQERRAAKAKGEPAMDTTEFLKLADKFIDVANRENRTHPATDLQMAFLYAAARYNAHVAKNVLSVEDHEAFVQQISGQYQEMLRNHLADPAV